MQLLTFAFVPVLTKMDMDKLGFSILQNYGLVGFIVVSVLGFCGWLFHKTLNHFMESIERKDEQNQTISTAFARALEANTKALHETNEINIVSRGVTEGFQEWLKEEAEQSRQAHGTILEYIRRSSIQ